MPVTVPVLIGLPLVTSKEKSKVSDALAGNEVASAQAPVARQVARCFRAFSFVASAGSTEAARFLRFMEEALNIR